MVEFSNLKGFVETHYQLDIQNIYNLTKKTYKLATDNHDYLLKFASGDDEFIMKQLFAYKVMPSSVLPIYRTKSKTHDVKLDNQFAYLTDYIQTIPVPLEKQVQYYIELLKKLHHETELIVDLNEDKLMSIYDNEYKKLQKSYAQLQKNIEAFELKQDRSPYEWYFMMVYPILYGILHRANDELKKFYDLMKKEKKMPTCLIHGDVNVANLLVSEKATYLINFEKSEFGISSLDMSQFLKYYHHVPGVQSILLDYIKDEKNHMVKHYFFFKSLCVDIDDLLNADQNHSLTNIALLNEIIAPNILAMQIYDEIHKPPPPVEKTNPFKDALNAAK